jgi:mono/diheme cytochrome c family protein
MFAAKDPVAMELLAKYKEPMSDPGLTPEDVDAVIEYLMEADSAIKTSQKSEAAVVSLPSAGAMNPPGQEAVVNKPATQAEAEKGKALFQGTQRFSRGGPSCYACHDLRNSSTATAGVGRLAKELTGAYSRLGEVRMRAILEKTPFPLMREAYGENPLTVDEISDLAAFLERASKRPEEEPLELYGDAMSLIGLAGFAILLGFYGVFWSKRRNHPVNKDVYDRQTKSEDGS